MWNKKTDKPNKVGLVEQLCWSCQNAVKKCPWIANFIPVKGWVAEPDRNGYKIYDCPLFKPDGESGGNVI